MSKKLIFILLTFFLGCATANQGSYGVAGITNIKKTYKNGLMQVDYYLHFGKATDRFSVYYYKNAGEGWVRASVIHHDFPRYLNRESKRTISLQNGFYATPGHPVKIEIIAYFDLMEGFSDVVQYEYVFRPEEIGN